MQELVGRMTSLDPEASESLKVISYFDALVDGHASIEAILRGAAILSGCASGFVATRYAVAVDSEGTRITAPDAPLPTRWPGNQVPPDGFVWLERQGPAHANDAMILERMSLALAITVERSLPISDSRRAVATLIDPSSSLEERKISCGQLQLSFEDRYLIIAEPASTPAALGHRTVVATPVGAIRATIARASDEVRPSGRAGFGYATTPDTLDQSWKYALTALRLTTTDKPIIYANNLGGLTLLADATSDHGFTHPDLTSLTRAIEHSPRTLALADAIVSTESVRAAAAKLGLHHSTVQSHVVELSAVLGYELSTPEGHTRLSIALSLHRLMTTRF